MGFSSLIKSILVLFVVDCLFCWMFTSRWMFGPVITIVCFLGGVLFIGCLGVVALKSDHDQ